MKLHKFCQECAVGKLVNRMKTMFLEDDTFDTYYSTKKSNLARFLIDIMDEICQACKVRKTMDILRERHPCEWCKARKHDGYIDRIGVSICPDCLGYGFNRDVLWEECSRCQGKGKHEIWENNNLITKRCPCEVCQGRGKVPSNIEWEVVEELEGIEMKPISNIRFHYYKGKDHRVFKLVEFLRRELEAQT